ncbi:GlxA family transcriptional regulator [Kiloniella laminariae]|uniref:GlxA family transcriptional regulator n=1 Tax=Kiloniella laminariae TaxID=454162 RepID=UPI0003743EC4|nr:helix-turn-helix domain-containing protein [Kiloniella laminariae]
MQFKVYSSDHTVNRKNIKRDLQRIVLVVLPGTASLDVSLMIQALKTANAVTGYAAFHWRIATLDGKSIDLEDGFILHPQMQIGEDEALDLALIYGEWGINTGRSVLLSNWLKRLDRQDVYLGAIGGACYELANANLLNGFDCAVPWSYHDSFRELFPEVHIKEALFYWDRKRVTCTGRAACLDMVLRVIDHQCGAEVAGQVAEAFNYEVRGAAAVPLRQRNLTLQKMSGKLAEAVRIMEENLEMLMSAEEIAEEIGSSKRQLERLFSRHLDCSPKRYYKRLRLKKARALLRQTALPVSEVAVACGFTSFSYFSRAYRGFFGSTPKEDRISRLG